MAEKNAIDFIIQKGYLPKETKDFAKDLLEETKTNPFTGTPAREFTIDGNKYYWSQGVIYDYSGNKVGNAAEDVNTTQVIKNIFNALGYRGDLFGQVTGEMEKVAKSEGWIPPEGTKETENTSGAASGKSYVNTNNGTILTPKTKAEEDNLIALGFKQPGQQTAATTGGDDGTTTNQLSPQIMAVIKGRSDLAGLYDLNTGQAKNPNDPRVKDIPTLSDWWSKYGINEYPSLASSTAATETGTGTGTGTGDVNTEQARLDAAYAKIDEAVANGVLTAEQAQAYKDVVAAYPPGIEFDAGEIINTFNKIKNETIDPYYRGLMDFEVNNLKSSVDQLQKERVIELENEGMERDEAIRNAVKELESSGLTFSGDAISQLGAGAAYAKSGEATNPVVPEQTGTVEGTIPQQVRLIASSSQLRQEEAMKNLGQSAESQLGSEKVAGLGIPYYTPTGNVTGSLQVQQQQQEGGTLSQLLENYKERQASIQNIKYPYSTPSL